MMKEWVAGPVGFEPTILGSLRAEVAPKAHVLVLARLRALDFPFGPVDTIILLGHCETSKVAEIFVRANHVKLP